MSQILNDIELLKAVNRINKKYDISAALRKQAKAMTEATGQDVSVDDIIPPGYVKFQFRPGRSFFQVFTIPEQIVGEAALMGEAPVEVSEIGKALAMGRKFREAIVPSEVAETMQKFSNVTPNSSITQVARELNTAWKAWTLISPPRLSHPLKAVRRVHFTPVGVKSPITHGVDFFAVLGR